MSWFWGGSDDSKNATSSSSFDSSSESKFSSMDNSSFGDSFSSSSTDLGLGSSSSTTSQAANEAELQNFLAIEQQKAQLQTMIHRLNDVCWETCSVPADSKLSSRTETCISNCVGRFIDTSLFITNRFAQLMTKSGKF